jgi:hypothetical protein
MAYVVQSMVEDHHEVSLFTHYETAKRFARTMPRSMLYHQKQVRSIDKDNRLVLNPGDNKPIPLPPKDAPTYQRWSAN